nr:Rab family GTPase [Candidatus Njordarchaeum guaymaensis]
MAEEPKKTTSKMFNFKVVIVGDGAVGKTTLIRRHAKGKFEFDVLPTIGVDITSKYYRLPSGLLLMLSIWDIAGQELFKTVRHEYYKGASAAMLVFDMTSPESFWRVKTWYVDLRDNLQQRIPTVLMGNKKDLGAHRAIMESEAKDLAEGYGFKYFETSALTGENVDKAFYNLIAQIIVEKKLTATVTHIEEA